MSCPYDCDCVNDPARVTVGKYIWPRWKRWLLFWRWEAGTTASYGMFR